MVHLDTTAGSPTTQTSLASPNPPTHIRTTASDSTRMTHVEYPVTTPTSATTATNLDTPTLGAQSHHNRTADLATTTTIKPLLVSGLSPPQPLPVHITTPVNIPYFSELLVNHPDQKLVQYLVNGLTYGFDIGINKSPSPSRPRNHKSARDNPEGVTKAIEKELIAGHIAGPFGVPPWPDLHCSPLGAREKDDGTFRIITDLSYPEGDSVNSFISKDDFTVEYTGFDAATDLVRRVGCGCLMFKIDIKHAFRVLPIKPSQWIFMGSEWMGYYFVDFRLPFGLRSSPGIFTKFADAVCWIIRNIYQLPLTIHYSDDYFFVTLHPNSAQSNFEVAIQAFRDLGLPVAIEKTVPPTTCLPFLGIEIDSQEMTMKVPADKKREIFNLLKIWNGRRKCTKTELLSFTGKLSHICKVVRPGRIFLRRLFDLSKTVTSGHHHIYLNSNSRGDIQWWVDFLPNWSESTIIPETYAILSSDIRLFTDASKMGLGAIYGKRWIQARWPPSMAALNTGSAIDIDYLELFAIFAACATWGHIWAGKRIIISTDNKPITDVWQAGTSKSPRIMNLVRKTFLEAANHQFSLSLKFIPGKVNTVADNISRFQVAMFKMEVPDAEPEPTPLPAHVKLLMLQ